MRTNIDPLLRVMDRPDLWNHVGLPAREYRPIIYAVSENNVELARLMQGDPVRLLQTAVEYASALLDHNKRLTEVEEMLRELKEVEDWIAANYRPTFGADAKKLYDAKARRRSLFQTRLKDYFVEVGIPIESSQYTYGSYLGIYQSLDVKIVQGRCKLIGETLMKLKEMLPQK